MALEQEIKLSVEGDTLSLAAMDYPDFQRGEISQHHLVSHYVDTPQATLVNNGFGLRRRFDGQQWYQTVKETGKVVQGLHQRQEWQHKIASDQFDLSQLRQTPLKPWIDDEAVWSSLTTWFTTDFIRHSCLLSDASGTIIELAYDQGHIVSGDKRQVIHEIELELMAGELEQMQALSQQLQVDWPLTPTDISKAQHGYALAMAKS